MLSFRTGRPEGTPAGAGHAAAGRPAPTRGLSSADRIPPRTDRAAGVLPRGASCGTPARRQPASRTSRATRAGSVRTTSRVPIIK